MRNVVCYEIDDVCYYLTAGQDKMLAKLVKGEDRDRRIKKWAYCSGPKGQPIKDPEGTGIEAIVMPEGEEIWEGASKVEEVEASVVEEPLEVTEAPADDPVEAQAEVIPEFNV